MIQRWGIALVVLIAAAAVMAGCEVGPNYSKPNIPVSGSFNEATTHPSSRPIDLAEIPSAPQLVRWWETFHDPELNHLIYHAVQANLSLQVSVEKVRQNRALLGVAEAGLFPTVNAIGNYSHSRRSAHLGSASASSSNSTGSTGSSGSAVGGSGPNLEGDFYQAGFDSTWELDIWGGIRRGVEVAQANLEASEEDRRSVLITLLGEVASDYVTLRGLQEQVTITQQNITIQEQTLQLIETQNRAGLVADLAVTQERAQVLTTESQLPDLEAQIHQQIHALSVLLDEEPAALESELSPPRPIPTGPQYVPPGLPSDLLRRRPDIREAERQLAAASAEIGVATAELYPQFSLTGSFGYESSQFHQLFNLYSRYFSLGPSVSWPIFTAGSLQANIQVQNTLERQAFYNYASAILTGLQEVEDDLIAYAKEQDKRALLEQAVVADQRAVELTQSLYRNGLDTFLDVLTSQNTLLAAQESLVASEQQVSLDLVALYKALGGGWEVSPK